MSMCLSQVGTGPPPPAPDGAAARAPLRQALAAWQADARGPSKLCYMLDHQYTEVRIDIWRFVVEAIFSGCVCQRPAVHCAGASVHTGGLWLLYMHATCGLPYGQIHAALPPATQLRCS